MSQIKGEGCYGEIPEQLEERAHTLTMQGTSLHLQAHTARVEGNDDLADYYASEADSLHDWATSIYQELGVTAL